VPINADTIESMTGLYALTLGVIAIVILAGVTLYVSRMGKRSRALVPPLPDAATDGGKVYDLAEAEALANEAEREGNCEFAAELLESVGMLRRATDLYRRSGNIQKAAELELESLQLTRLANDVPLPRAQPSDVAWEDAGDTLHAGAEFGSLPPSSLPPVRSTFGDGDYRSVPSELPMPIASTKPPGARGASIPPHFAQRSIPPTFAASSFPPAFSSRPPARVVGSTPPRRKKSSAPPRPISNRPRARTPSVEELLEMLSRFAEPDLGNIEIHYRLGLAYLAAKQLSEARQAFLTVEDISPGYRDANAYLEQLLPPVGEHAVVTQGSGPANNNATHAERSTATGRRRNER
jgi:tetratricopeptide (TPR) repeat protein